MLGLVLAGFSSAFGEEEPSALDTFLEDHGMLAGTVAFIVILVVAILLTAGAFKRTARQKAMAPVAAKHGLRYSFEDPFGCTTVAFPIFRMGEGRTVENVMWGDSANGTTARVFDYAFYDEYKSQEGQVSRSYEYFTCAMVQHNGLWPPIRVARERKLDKALQKAGLPDIELESEEFNRTFVVQCEDRKFATDLLSPEMMEYLLGTEGAFDFETKGRWLLVAAKRLEAREMPAFLNLAREFLQRIPAVVWDLYPQAPEGDALAEGGIDLSNLSPSVSAAMLEEHREERRRGSGVEYDLDGNPIQPGNENPWT
jgi:hypothetical protein